MFNLKGRSAEELIVLGMALVSLCGQIPYGIYRFSLGDYLIASIDMFGAVLCIAAIYYVLKFRSVWLFGALMSMAAVFGVLVIVANRGVEDVHFIYPVVVFSYFLLRPERALALSVAAFIGLGVILYEQVNLFFLSKILLSILGCSVFAYVFATIRNTQSAQLTLLSTRDPLTMVLNRRSLDDRLNQFVLQTKRQTATAVLIILDLDNFKEINDRYGHGVGDKVLKRVADTLTQRIRATDQLYRYGGDEFVVFVSDVTLQQSLGLAEDLRARVEATEAMEGTGLSISLGVSQYRQGQSANEWLDSADVGLLEAKSTGRNQVVTTSV